MLADVSEELTASIFKTMSVLRMQAVSCSETSVSVYETTRRNIPEGSQLHSRRHENLKSHIPSLVDDYQSFG
jgi:hypothetical protein